VEMKNPSQPSLFKGRSRGKMSNGLLPNLPTTPPSNEFGEGAEHGR